MRNECSEWRSATADARKASLTAASLPRARAQLISVLSKWERFPEPARHTFEKTIRAEVGEASAWCVEDRPASQRYSSGVAHMALRVAQTGLRVQARWGAHPRRVWVSVCVPGSVPPSEARWIFTARDRHFVLADTSIHPRTVSISDSRCNGSSMPSNAPRPVAAPEMRQNESGS